MRIGVDVTLNQRDLQRLRKLDRALDRMQRRAQRRIKGLGDFLGMTMVGIGAVIFMLAVSSADGVPTEYLDKWCFITLCGLLIGVAGSWLLGWMRS